MPLTLSNNGTNGSLKLSAVQNANGKLELTNAIQVPPSFPYVTTGLVLNLDGQSYIGSGNWLDSSGNANNAILVQTPTYSTNNGGFFDLNGGSITATGQVDSFSIADNSSLDVMTAITIEMWVNIDSIQGTSSPNMLFSKRAVNTNGYVAFFTSTAYTFRIGTSSPTQLTWSTTPTVGSWQQLTITVGSSGGKVYQNGIEVQNAPSYTGNFGNIDTGASLVIGDINPNNIGIFGFDGKIAVIRMYNSILSATDVLQNYNAIKDRFGL